MKQPMIRMASGAGLGLLLALTALAAPSARAADLSITVDGAGPRGALRVAAFADAASFDARTPAAAQAVLENGRAAVTLHGLVAGVYAVAVFQDVDGDQTLNTGLFGSPTEPYGFSNDARGRAGPPSFSAASFVLGDGGGAIRIRLEQP